MIKIEEVKVETIDNQAKIGEKVETIYPETIETPTYDYWTSQNTLDYNIAIRNKPSAWGGQYYTGFIQRLSSAGTGAYSITWIWFSPKLVKITASYSANPWQVSIWTSANACIFISTWSSGVSSYNNARIIDVWSSRASFTSLDSDWFTLNWTSMGVTVDILYECYW